VDAHSLDWAKLDLAPRRTELRALFILLGFAIASTGLLLMLAQPNGWLANLTFVGGVCLFYSAAFALRRKSRRVFVSN